MSLIPIPHEEAQKIMNPVKLNKMVQIRVKLRSKAASHDKKIFKKTCMKMVEYLASGNKFSTTEIGDLIDCMYRSIISLQKRKQELNCTKIKRNRV